MKRIVLGSFTLAMAWVGVADSCSALPVFTPQPVAEAEAAFLLTRHRRHHHHWRGHHRHSRRGGPAPEGLNPPAGEGDSGRFSTYPAPETGSGQPPTAAPAETAPPPARRSTRWVNPDKRRG
jgi:hypothetical protein